MERSAQRRDISMTIYNGIHRGVGMAAYTANFVLALLMIAMAVYHAYTVLKDGSEIHVTAFIGYSVLMACGLVIIVDRKRDLPRSVGLYAIGIGLYRVFTSIPHLVPHSEINLAYYLIMAIGLNLSISGRAYLMGKSRARNTMMMGSIAFLLIATIMIIYLYSETKDIASVVRDHPNTVLQALMYFTFILILDSEKLRRLDWLEVHNRTLDGMRRTYHLQHDAHMLRSDAEMLMNGMNTCDGWMAVDDGGPVTREFHARIANGDGTTFIIAQRWVGSNNIYMTVSDHEDGTLIQASRLTVTGLELTDESVSFICSDGTLVSIALTEEFQ